MNNLENFIIIIGDYGEPLPDEVEYMGPFGSLAEARQPYHYCIMHLADISQYLPTFISDTIVICRENNQRYDGKIYQLRQSS